MIEDEVKRREYNDKCKEYYYKNRDKVNTRYLMKYYGRKALDANIDITGLTLDEIKYKFLEYKINKKKESVK